MPLNVAILVGGKGTRIGHEKGLIRIGERTFIEILTNRFRDCNLVIVCRDKEQMKIYRRFGRTIEDEIKDFGPLAGIYSALNYFKDYTLIIAVDMPFIKRALAEFLFKTAVDNNLDAIIPVWSDGKKEPLLACYSSSSVKEIERSIRNGNRRVVKPFENLNTLFYPIERLRVFDKNLVSFININTKNDLEMVKCLSIDMEGL